MTPAPSLGQKLSVWERFAAWLGFLAVLSALVAPATMLAEEVRTGKLGGICSFNTANAGNSAAGDDSTPQTGSHCDWCSSVALAPPPLLAAAMLSTAPGNHVAVAASAAHLAASIAGLPFSRGPPAL